MKKPKTVLIVFSSGKYVCIGAKNEEMVKNAVHNLHKEFNDYKLYYTQ